MLNDSLIKLSASDIQQPTGERVVVYFAIRFWYKHELMITKIEAVLEPLIVKPQDASWV